ncbi:MAG: hypothetical protein H5U03_03595, partial [Clostridia bacterium]|nr:hypothetical protein [Clostridia bacterium]
EYFRTHYLPGPGWAGWRPEVNLEDVKVRVVTSMGKDIHDFDIWPDDVERASRPGVPTISQPFVPNVGGAELRRRLEEILLGLGLEDVSVSVSPADRMRVEIELTRDRTEEIRERLRKDLPAFIAA